MKKIIITFFSVTTILTLIGCGAEERSGLKRLTTDFGATQTYIYTVDSTLKNSVENELHTAAVANSGISKSVNIREFYTGSETTRFTRPNPDWRPGIYARTTGRSQTSMIFIPKASGPTDLLVASTGTFDGDPTLQPTASLSVSAKLFTAAEARSKGNRSYRLSITFKTEIANENSPSTWLGSGRAVNYSGTRISLLCLDPNNSRPIRLAGDGFRQVGRISSNWIDTSHVASGSINFANCNGDISLNANVEGRRVRFQELRWTGMCQPF